MVPDELIRAPILIYILILAITIYSGIIIINGALLAIQPQ